jgi:thiol-disulfide isomerase/thioredoxin
MPFLRPRFPVVLAVLLAAGAVGVLYVIHATAVHVPGKPPADLAYLELERPKATPSVAFSKPDGSRATLASFANRYVLVNLWASWCAPCVRELPQLARLKLAMPGLSVVAVNVGRQNFPDTVAFLKSHGAGGLPVYVDSDAMLIREFGTEGMPFSVLIDPNGHEIARALGPCDWATPAAVSYLRALTSRAPRTSS